jgi:hypothetical protein
MNSPEPLLFSAGLSGAAVAASRRRGLHFSPVPDHNGRATRPMGEQAMPDDPRAEFLACLSRAGLTVPPERQAVMFAAFQGYRELAALLDAPLPYGAEPAAAYLPPAPAR